MNYEELLSSVFYHGSNQNQRAKTKDGKPLSVRYSWGPQIRYHLELGFPLITSKRMSWDIVTHELLWFLSGDTNISYLQNRGIKIWDAWADEDGELGPVYGKQWRRWEGRFSTVDQIARLVSDLKAVKENPSHHSARRLILTSWNPGDMPEDKVPTGCHTLAQFSIRDRKYLNIHLYQRSGDMFLGVPYNIACYSLLTHILANIVGLVPSLYVHSFGDAHIYNNHLEQVEEQLQRIPPRLPKLEIKGKIQDIDKIDPAQFVLINYQPLGSLKGEVAI